MRLHSLTIDFLALPTHFLLAAAVLIVGILILITTFMLVYLLNRKKREKKNKKWKLHVGSFLNSVIFFEPVDGTREFIPIPFKIKRNLRIPAFRQYLVNELIKGKKSLSGTASENLVRIYDQLNLKKDSALKLSSLKWHVKVQGIQELTFMCQKDMLTKIYRLANNRNEYVRMEAQTAIVQFYGFEGLRFLDIIQYPLSEWQQIKLLELLSRASDPFRERFEAWLVSPNISVIQFALKLAGINHRFELHDKVAACLEHPSPIVKIQAVKCLQEIYNESTAAIIIRTYPLQQKTYCLAVLHALQVMATVPEIPFLLEELMNGDNAIKLMAAKALVTIKEHGMKSLDDFLFSDDYPWNEIIQQVKTAEVA